MPNNVGASTQPCLTPLLTGKGSEVPPLKHTVLWMPSWKDVVMPSSLGGHPIFRRSLKRPSLLTKSNAFVRSMKARYKGSSLVTDATRKSCPLWIFRRENRTGTKGRFAPRGSVGVSRPLGRMLCRQC